MIEDLATWLALNGEIINAISQGQVLRSVTIQIAYIEPFMIANEKGQLFLDKWASLIASKCNIPEQDIPRVRALVELCLREISMNGGVIL